jgi:cyclopropane fatty-acyl-phospholipid synthase-like methyltransferase
VNHRFHDREYVKSYAASINERRPERLKIFEHAADLIDDLPFETPHVVELCIGSGMLADVLLTRLPKMTYEGVDFSQPMLDLAKDTLASFIDRIALYQANLNTDDWAGVLHPPVHAIVSNMALHDLGSKENVRKTYECAFRMIEPGGLICNADLVLPADSEPGTGGRFKVSEHIDTLETIGFSDVRSTFDFGGYACVVGRK